MQPTKSSIMPIPVVERSEKETARKIRRRIQSIDHVADCKEVTMGFTRKKPNIHLHVTLKGNPSFQETHKLCVRIDREVRNLVPNARVSIHSESQETGSPENVWKLVKKIADAEPGTRGVENIHLRNDSGRLGLDFQLHLSSRLTREQYNDLEARIAGGLKAADSRISDVFIHKQTVSRLIHSEQEGHGTELRAYLEHVARRFPELEWLGPLGTRMALDGMHLVDRVAFAPGTTGERMSEITAELGAAIQGGYPANVKADIIVESRRIGEA